MHGIYILCPNEITLCSYTSRYWAPPKAINLRTLDWYYGETTMAKSKLYQTKMREAINNYDQFYFKRGIVIIDKSIWNIPYCTRQGWRLPKSQFIISTYNHKRRKIRKRSFLPSFFSVCMLKRINCGVTNHATAVQEGISIVLLSLYPYPRGRGLIKNAHGPCFHFRLLPLPCSLSGLVLLIKKS